MHLMALGSNLDHTLLGRWIKVAHLKTLRERDPKRLVLGRVFLEHGHEFWSLRVLEGLLNRKQLR